MQLCIGVIVRKKEKRRHIRSCCNLFTQYEWQPTEHRNLSLFILPFYSILNFNSSRGLPNLIWFSWSFHSMFKCFMVLYFLFPFYSKLACFIKNTYSIFDHQKKKTKHKKRFFWKKKMNRLDYDRFGTKEKYRAISSRF